MVKEVIPHGGNTQTSYGYHTRDALCSAVLHSYSTSVRMEVQRSHNMISYGMEVIPPCATAIGWDLVCALYTTSYVLIPCQHSTINHFEVAVLVLRLRGPIRYLVVQRTTQWYNIPSLDILCVGYQHAICGIYNVVHTKPSWWYSQTQYVIGSMPTSTSPVTERHLRNTLVVLYGTSSTSHLVLTRTLQTYSQDLHSIHRTCTQGDTVGHPACPTQGYVTLEHVFSCVGITCAKHIWWLCYTVSMVDILRKHPSQRASLSLHRWLMVQDAI